MLCKLGDKQCKTGELPESGEWNSKNETSENHREFIIYYKALKIVQEWLPRILSLPQVIENSRQFVLLRTDISQKIVVGCPWFPVQ